jgi:transposase
LEKLHRYQRNVTGNEYVKITCLLMLAKRYSAEAVSDCFGIDVSSVYRYWNLYKTSGLDDYLANKHKCYWGLLSSQRLSLLRTELNHTLYTEAKSVARWIKDDFGVAYTPEGRLYLLRRTGFGYKKIKEIPCECSEEKQQTFVEELSEVLDDLDEAAVVYYAYGVHPARNSRSTYAWMEKGKDMEQPTVSGRDMVNINGLVNARGVTDVIYVDSQSINAQNPPRNSIKSH